MLKKYPLTFSQNWLQEKVPVVFGSFWWNPILFCSCYRALSHDPCQSKKKKMITNINHKDPKLLFHFLLVANCLYRLSFLWFSNFGSIYWHATNNLSSTNANKYGPMGLYQVPSFTYLIVTLFIMINR